MKFRGLIAAVAVAVICSGCSVIKDSKDMKNTLQELKGKGDHIAKRADDLEREMKFKESTAMFAFAIEYLFGENGKAGQNPESGVVNVETAMVEYAEIAIRSLMFQFWKGDFYEYSERSLDVEFTTAAAMFYTRIAQYIPRDFDINVLMPDRKFKALASLGARMEQIQPAYADALKKRRLPQNLSLYEVTAMALKDRDLPQQVGLLPMTKAKILQWAPEAVYLLQVRHNYLPMLALSRMTDLGDRGDMKRAWMAIRGQKIDLNSTNPGKIVTFEQLREWTYWLNQAIETRARLRALGIEPKYNSAIGTMLRAPDFGQAALLASTDAQVRAMDARQKMVYDFAKAYVQVVQEMPNLIPEFSMPVLPTITLPDFRNATPPLPAALDPKKLM